MSAPGAVPASGAGAAGGRDLEQAAQELAQTFGFAVDRQLLERALVHRSFAYENGGLPTNERLEFLGDAVLGLVVTDALYRRFPELPEGQLAKLRAAVVNSRALADVARRLGLGRHVRLGRGEESSGGRDKSSILADTLEAVLGAVYLDRGLDRAAAVVHLLFDALLEQSATLGAGLDWKTSLQELSAAELLGVPEYRIEESGPDHAKSFRATALVGGEPMGGGEGRSKKEAEQKAAEAAWTRLRERARQALQAHDAAHVAPDGAPPAGPDGAPPAGPGGAAPAVADGQAASGRSAEPPAGATAG